MKILPTGDANFWRVMDGDRWIAVIQFNGELMEARQAELGQQFVCAPELLRAAKITNKVVGEKRIEGMDQNPMAWRDILFSAISKAERKP